MQVEINNTVYDSNIQPITITIDKSELNKINQSQYDKNPYIITFNTKHELIESNNQ